MIDYEFINRSLYLPEKKTIVIGDLHIGYESSMIKAGILTPKSEMKELVNDLKDIFETLREQEKEFNKIVFLGDISHAFQFSHEEKYQFQDVLSFLKEYFQEENIIFLKGNHDTIDYSFSGKIKDYYIEEDTAFIHGHKTFKEIEKPEIKTLIMGHIHPSIILADEHTSKKENYKCFLIGKSQKKEIIILPSFPTNSVGSPVNNYDFEYEDYFSIIPKRDILKFDAYAIGEKETFEFGKVEELI